MANFLSKLGGGGAKSAADKARIRRREKKVVIASLIFSIVYTAAFWLNQIYCTPVELYHRIWVTSGKFFYDRDKMKDWGVWEHKYDKEIKSQDDAEKYAGVMLKSLDDSFTTFYNARATARQTDAHDGFYSGVGMVMNSKTHPISVRRVMDGSPAQSAGVKPGDLILSVDGIDCSRIEATKIGDHTRDKMNHLVRFMMSRAGKKLEMDMVPSKIPVATTVSKILPGNIAYERIEGFTRQNVPQLVAKDFTSLTKCRALILDLRGNPGGAVDECLQVASSMLDQAPLVSLRSRTADGGFVTYKYVLTKNDLTVDEISEGKNKGTKTSHRRRLTNVWDKKPIIILVDEFSASAAEMVAAALADNGRAKLVGTRTFGKGVAQIYFPMPMATCLAVTAGRYFTPSGRWLGDGKDLNDAQRETAAGKLRGITPAYVVPAAKDLVYNEEHDNQLQYAINLLQGEK